MAARQASSEDSDPAALEQTVVTATPPTATRNGKRLPTLSERAPDNRLPKSFPTKSTERRAPFSELPALNSSAMASLTRENNIVNEPASMHKEPPHKISTT